MTRVLALTFGEAAQASTWFRVYQYTRLLAKEGIELEPVPAKTFDAWGSIPRYDTVLLQKSLLRAGKLRRLRRLSRRLIYDTDDAIWHPHGRKHFFLTNWRQGLRLKTVAGAADLCTVANDVLARHLRKWSARVAVVPMALDERQWYFGRANLGNQVRIGWSGSPVNLTYIETIEPALLEVQSRFPEVEFAIFCGQRPNFERLKYVHLPFKSGTEPEVLRTFDIGLLPLPEDSFAAGKSPIKGLQYMASGAAVVLSPVGAAAEMFVEGETALFARDNHGWMEGLGRLIQDGQRRQSLAAKARAVFEKNFSLTANVRRVAAALTGSGELLP